MFVLRPAAPMFGYADVPAVTETPGVRGISVPMIPLIVPPAPTFVIPTLRKLHSLESMCPSPLPPEMVALAISNPLEAPWTEGKVARLRRRRRIASKANPNRERSGRKETEVFRIMHPADRWVRGYILSLLVAKRGVFGKIFGQACTKDGHASF